jgi:hypothetical protein
VSGVDARLDRSMSRAPVIRSTFPDITGQLPRRSTAPTRGAIYSTTQNQPAEDAMNRHEHRIERLVDRLPDRLQTTIRWLRQPGFRWVRVAAGVLFIAGSFLSILPIFGIWMLPLGLLLLAEDIPALRRGRDRLLDWIERHRPHWLAGSNADSKTQAYMKGEEEVMKSFTDREKGFEAEFKHNQELRFRVTARRNRLFGLWVAAKLGIPSGEEAEAYAKTVVAADFEAPGDADIINKVRTDLEMKGISVSEAELRTELERAAVDARRQIAHS